MATANPAFDLAGAAGQLLPRRGEPCRALRRGSARLHRPEHRYSRLTDKFGIGRFPPSRQKIGGTITRAFGGCARRRSTDFTFVDARRRRRIVPIVAPGRMIEVDYKVAIVRRNRFAKNQASDTRPGAKAAPLKECRAVRRTLIRYLDAKGQCALRGRVS